MEKHARIQASRRAHKAHTTRILNKCKEILAKENPDEMEINSLNTSFDQLVRKRTLIRELDQKIEAKITDAKELEADIFEAEELSCEVEEKIDHIGFIYQYYKHSVYCYSSRKYRHKFISYFTEYKYSLSRTVTCTCQRPVTDTCSINDLWYPICTK